MPNSYTKSKRADQDINHITKRSLADFGDMQTDKYLDGLLKSLGILADSAEIGRVFIHSKTKKSYLFHPYISHVIYYRQRKKDIFIVRILHKKMLPEKHL